MISCSCSSPCLCRQVALVVLFPFSSLCDSPLALLLLLSSIAWLLLVLMLVVVVVVLSSQGSKRGP